MRFAISTRACVDVSLGERHLAAFAAAGFSGIELFLADGHFSHGNAAAAADLARWTAAEGLAIAAVHAAVSDQGASQTRVPRPTIADTNPAKRLQAVQDTEATMELCHAIGAPTVIVHLGGAADGPPGDAASAKEACRSLDRLAARTSETGVRLALEVLPTQLARAGRLVDLIENELDEGDVGVCFDCGHAHLSGDVVDDLELASGHLLAVHLHDNAGRHDDHLLPFEGSVDWAATLMTLQKVGYEGPLVLTPAARRPLDELLDRASASCRRLEDLWA